MTTLNPIAVAAKSAARKALIAKSYGLKKGKDARAAAQKVAIAQSYKKKAQQKIVAAAVAAKVTAFYKNKGRSVRTTESQAVVAG